MQALLAAELAVEGDREDRSLARRDRMTVDAREHLDVLAVLGDPRRADEDRAHGPPSSPATASRPRSS